MNEIALLVFLATSFESVAQYVWSLRKWRESIPAYIALVLALAAVITLRVDIFAVLGFTVPYTWVTPLLTGFALGRGATFLHDLMSWAQAKKEAARVIVGTPVRQVEDVVEGQK